MKIWKREPIYVMFAILAFILSSGVSLASLLPEGLIIENEFISGYGLSVGRVDLVQGQAVIIHLNQNRGFWARTDLPLFKGDTIVTKEKTRIRFRLNDGSIMTMASNTKLIITRSIYNKKKKNRSSFLNLVLGKARFFVTKMFAYRRSTFKVKSATAVVGVRGSDWIEEATETSTRVTAFENTRLEVISTAAPEVPPVVVEEFEQTVIKEGALPSEIEHISPEEVDKIKKDFVVTPEIEEGTEEKVIKGETGKTGGGEKTTPEKIEEKPILNIEEPVQTGEEAQPGNIEEPLTNEVIEQQETSEQINQSEEQQETIFEEKVNDVLIQELPSFPDTPN